MSKALEILKEIKQAPAFMGGNPRYSNNTQSSIPFLEDIAMIEKELKEYELVKPIFKQLFSFWFKSSESMVDLTNGDIDKDVFVKEMDKYFNEVHFQQFDILEVLYNE